jgi:hypothetical protein
VWLPNELATARVGRFTTAVAMVKRESGGRRGQIELTATSESDGRRSDTATCDTVAR